jgi:hypothetical protein
MDCFVATLLAKTVWGEALLAKTVWGEALLAKTASEDVPRIDAWVEAFS